MTPVRGAVKTRVHTVVGRRELNLSAYVLTLTREGLEFSPGQHVHLGLANSSDLREYSIYSGTDDETIEVLIREIPAGLVSKQLRNLEESDSVRLEGPFGYFTLPLDEHGTTQQARFLLVATGTGIAPFRSFVRSVPSFDYTLLHGVGTGLDRFEYHDYDGSRLTTCLTRQTIDEASLEAQSDIAQGTHAGGDERLLEAEHHWFEGRVTDYLRSHPVSPDTRCYLCGNCDMIYEVFDILRSGGVPTANLYSEVYF